MMVVVDGIIIDVVFGIVIAVVIVLLFVFVWSPDA